MPPSSVRTSVRRAGAATVPETPAATAAVDRTKGTRDGRAREVLVVPYDPAWPMRFADIRDAIAPALAGVASVIEHVGSTAVPGLAAKPIVDVDVIVEDAAAVGAAIARLEDLGYRHLGDLGIAGREAFAAPARDPAVVADGVLGGDHNLYVCLRGVPAVENHLRLRDRLRADPALARAYADLKRGLARAHPRDIDAYVAGKTAFVTGVLREAGMTDEDLAAIAAANDGGRSGRGAGGR